MSFSNLRPRLSTPIEEWSFIYLTFLSECDSPFRLTNFTLDYLAKTWAHEIDFVICMRTMSLCSMNIR